MKRILVVLILIVSLVAAGNLSCSSAKGGVVAGQLKDCPSSPNCICSTDGKDTHRTAPLDLGKDPEAGWETLVAVLAAFPRTHIDTREADYVHAVVTSKIFRFRDDLELLFDRERGLAQVRSASRLGFSDLGVNRERVKELRRRLAEALAAQPADASG